MSKNIVKKVIGTTMLCSMLTYYTIPTFAYTNEEMVYSKSDVNGKNYKTIVSQTEETKEGTKNNQVESQKQLPIEMEVKYKLDGKDITAEELAGKKGKVSITIKYTNKDEKQVNINGTTEKMYTPFLVVSGVILENEYNKNVEINHGKVINNGSKTIVAGFAIPGLLDSLKLEDSSIEVSDTVEITMDTEKFEIGNIITYATPKVFSSLNIKMSDFNSLFNKVTDLQNATNKIVDGATALNEGIIIFDEGIDTLKDGSAKLDSGVGDLQKGSQTLNQGAAELQKGTSEYSSKSKEFNNAVSQVANGAKELNTKYSELDQGINTLNNSSSELVNGAKEVSEGTKAISSNLNTISGKLGEATTGSESLNSGLETAKTGVNKIVKEVKTQVDTANSTESQNSIKQMNTLAEQDEAAYNSLNQVNTALKAMDTSTMTAEQKAIIQNQIKANETAMKLLKGNSQAIKKSATTIKSTATSIGKLYNGLTELQTGIEKASAGASSLNNGLTQLNKGTSTLAEKSGELAKGTESLKTGTENLQAGTKTLAKGSSTVVEGIGTLSNGTTSLSSASNQLTSATKTIANGASSLSNGTQDLVNGVNTLKNGTADLSAGVNVLSTGSKALVEGSTELKEGIQKYKKEGIDNIVDLVNNKGKKLISRIEKLEELSENYNTFEDETKKRDEVAFINVMDSIGSDSNKKDDNNDKK